MELNLKFIEPTGLWLFIFLPLVMVLYMLKLRRQRQPVASTLLWRKLYEDVQANAFWQKLRRNILLLLQLLAVTLLALAFARPYLPAGTVYGTDLIVVLDNSGSMRAREGGTTRLDLAKEKIGRIFAGLERQDGVTLITTAPRARVVVKNETDRTRLARELALVPAGGAGGLAEGLAVARQLREADGGQFLYVFSDGEARDLPLGDAPDPNALWVPCGSSQPNLALVRADLRQAQPEAAPQLFVAVRNFAAQPASALLRLYAAERLIEARRESWAAGERKVLLFAIRAGSEDRLRVELDAEDALPDDNVAWLVGKRFRPLRVAFAGEPGGIVGRAVASLPEVELTAVSPAGGFAPEAYDLVIWERGAPAPGSGGRHCLLQPVPGRWGTATAADSRPQVVAWDRVRGPLARCNLNRLFIGEAHRLAVPETGRVLVHGSRGPLVVEADEGGQQLILFGFDVLRTDLPLRVAFPVFLQDLMLWARALAEGTEYNLAPGQLIAGTLTTPAAAVLTRPDGSRLEAPAGERYVFTATDQLGFYEVAAGAHRARYAVSLQDEGEADLRVAPRLTGAGGKPAASERPMQVELWPWFVLLACLLLAIEWWVYHRGTFSA